MHLSHVHTSLSSGLLILIGTMIGHSILMENQGFPYLSSAAYYYIIGKIEMVCSSITINDVSMDV